MRNWSLYHCDGVEDIMKSAKNLWIDSVWTSWWRSGEVSKIRKLEFVLMLADSHLLLN
jgi:hypothetical protein